MRVYLLQYYPCCRGPALYYPWPTSTLIYTETVGEASKFGVFIRISKVNAILYVALCLKEVPITDRRQAFKPPNIDREMQADHSYIYRGYRQQVVTVDEF